MKLLKRGKDAAPSDGSDQATATGAKGSSNLLPAIVVAVGLIIGGFLFGGRAPAPQEAEAAEATHAAPAKVKEEATHGPVQNLEPITLNLADGHFLKVGLALQLAEVEGGGHGAAEELPSAKALDIAITHLGSHTMDELASPKERELVKKKLSEQVATAYVDPETHESLVTKVYFTEFVMQ